MVTIVTLVKQSPDVEAVRIDPKTGQPDLSAAGLKVSDYDKNAVEAAVQLKEKNAGSKVHAVSLGGAKLPESIKEVLAMGCDEAHMVIDPAAAIQKIGGVDLVIAAEESLDSHSAQTGPRVAEELGWPLVSYVTDNLRIEGTTLKCEREVDEGLEDVEVELPCVITVTESLNTPRLPALMQILQAKNKPQKTLTLADLGGGEVKPVLARPSSVAPKSERKQQMLGGSAEEAAEELAKTLVKEGVIG